MDRARRSSIGGHRGIHQSRLPRHAEQVVDRLVSRLEHACAFPHSGRVVPEVAREAVRELIESPYRLIYRVHDDRGGRVDSSRSGERAAGRKLGVDAG